MFRMTTIGLAALAAASIPLLAQADELTPMSESFEQAGFEPIADKDGVSVYQDENSDVIRIGAEGRFAAPPAQVAATLLDYKDQVGRLGRLSACRVLSRGKSKLLVYQRLNLPVIDDRDFNLEVTWGQKDGIRWIRWHSVPRGLGPTPGVVRVTDHQGSWQLEPIDGGRATLARFQVRMDVAGWVPRWMARSGAGKNLPDVFQSLRRMLVDRMLLGGASCKSKPC